MLFETLFLISALLDPTPQPSGLDLARDLDRLQETARVLYVAAHPDDENTQLLAYMANARGWRTAYLSLTRGEGGQNAIGDTIGHGLGLIRTWELLAARQVDRAEQWIAAERDFGYSKSAEEALDVWGAEEALADVVWVVRRFRPDVMVTRFPENGRSHGHHIASARLARRAFELAGDPTAFPEQLEGPDAVGPWRPTRLLYNVPLRWMGGEIQDQWFTLDIGGFDALSGRSFGEIAAASRSMHRSQAFGSSARRGPEIEAFELLAGSEPDGEDPFADVPSGWASRPGGERLARALADASGGFDVRDPAASIPAMLVALDATEDLDIGDASDARTAIEAWIIGAAGIYVDARTEHAETSPGQAVEVALQVVARAEAGWTVLGARVGAAEVDGGGDRLEVNVPWTTDVAANIPADAPVTAPYWLREPAGVGRYAAGDRRQVGTPVGEPALSAVVTLQRDGATAFDVVVPVRSIHVDPTLGERVEPLRVLPGLLVQPGSDVVLLPNGDASNIEVTVRAMREVADGSVRLDVPSGWTVNPSEASLTLDAGELATVTFSLSAPPDAEPAELAVVTRVDGREDSWLGDRIDHPHLPPLSLLVPAHVRATPLRWSPPAGLVGYVMGPGDAVASSLASAGVDIRLLDDATLESGDLSVFRAILIGPRAFHERPPLRTHAERLWEFAERGGVVVVQYQTNNWSQVLDVPVGPNEITIGRGRVTVEQAPVSWTGAAAAVRDGLHTLDDSDFDGWVQERGLYFAETWAPEWEPLIEMSDPGEDPLRGALLVNRHGEGAVFYCGLSLFRQLPAGVPGAYRLLANLLAWEPSP